MIILFTKLNGEHVDTTDKTVLIEAAKNGEIVPDTVVTIDGMGIEARRIKGLVFGAPAPVPEPPKPEPAPSPKPEPTRPGELPEAVADAFSGLRGLAYISGGLSFIAGLPAVGIGLESENVVSIVTGAIISVGGVAQLIAVSWTLTILEYIAKK